jgi:hypothetical protein
MPTKFLFALPLLAVLTGCHVGGDRRQDTFTRLAHGAPIVEDSAPLPAVMASAAAPAATVAPEPVTPAPATPIVTASAAPDPAPVVDPIPVATASPPVIVPVVAPPPCVPVFRVTTCPDSP